MPLELIWIAVIVVAAIVVAGIVSAVTWYFTRSTESSSNSGRPLPAYKLQTPYGLEVSSSLELITGGDGSTQSIDVTVERLENSKYKFGYSDENGMYNLTIKLVDDVGQLYFDPVVSTEFILKQISGSDGYHLWVEDTGDAIQAIQGVTCYASGPRPISASGSTGPVVVDDVTLNDDPRLVFTFMDGESEAVTSFPDSPTTVPTFTALEECPNPVVLFAQQYGCNAPQSFNRATPLLLTLPSEYQAGADVRSFVWIARYDLPVDGQNRSRLIAIYNNDDTNNPGFLAIFARDLDPDADTDFRLFLDGDIDGGMGSDAITIKIPEAIVPQGQSEESYHHYAIVANGTTYTFYVDGVQRMGAAESLVTTRRGLFNTVEFGLHSPPDGDGGLTTGSNGNLRSFRVFNHAIDVPADYDDGRDLC